MALFIFYTACAMMMRWVPGVKEVGFDQGMSVSLPVLCLEPFLGGFHGSHLFLFCWRDPNYFWFRFRPGAFLDASNLLVGNICFLVVCCCYSFNYLASSFLIHATQIYFTVWEALSSKLNIQRTGWNSDSVHVRTRLSAKAFKPVYTEGQRPLIASNPLDLILAQLAQGSSSRRPQRS